MMGRLAVRNSTLLIAAFVIAFGVGATVAWAGFSLMGGAEARHETADSGQGVPRSGAGETADADRPLKGPLPDEVPLDGVGTSPVSIPHYIPVVDRSGEHAGYVHFDTFRDMQISASIAPLELDVYDDSLRRVVGRLVPDYGFIPTGASIADFDPFPVKVDLADPG
ncbi:MAG: hypothetical protein H0V93_13685 [Euzebyales bacterium]|jgi:hypothetical protein|nr:hypothetical protein [Euzebyales bacterium]